MPPSNEFAGLEVPQGKQSSSIFHRKQCCRIWIFFPFLGRRFVLQGGVWNNTWVWNNSWLLGLPLLLQHSGQIFIILIGKVAYLYSMTLPTLSLPCCCVNLTIACLNLRLPKRGILHPVTNSDSMSLSILYGRHRNMDLQTRVSGCVRKGNDNISCSE